MTKQTNQVLVSANDNATAVANTTAATNVVPADAAAIATVKVNDLKMPVKVKAASGKADATVDYTCALSLEGATEDDAAIIAKSKEEYVAAFKVGAENTARATLEMCRVVYEASRSLNGFEFSKFCTEIGFNDYSSTIRKFTAIGKLYPRFIQYADQLPSSWTNIYLITQIPAEYFEQMIAEGKSLTKLKGKTLETLVSETRDIKRVEDRMNYDKRNAGYVFGKMVFTKVPDDTDIRAIEKALNEVSSRLPVKFVIAQALKDLVEKRKAQRYSKAKRFYKHTDLRPDLWDLGAEANAVHHTTDEVKAAGEERFKQAA